MIPDRLLDEEEIETPPLRVLAARSEGDRLNVAFKSSELLSNLVIEGEEGIWPVTHVDHASSLAVFPMSRRLRSIVLAGTAVAGERVRSSDAWVDDEASLAAPASLRRIIRRLQDADTPGIDPAGEFRAVLDQFRDYLRDPDASRRRMLTNCYGRPMP
jgi:hypothetical protein